MAVGGSSDSRGVITTCNYEARKFGIHSAMASATAKRLCPDLILIPGRMDVYKDVSQQMHRIFYEYTELVEPLSLDEAFLDVSESDLHHGSATLIAQEIRQRISSEIGITVSAGIAPNKFLAKIASDWNKPNGQFVITPPQIDEFIIKLPVKKIHGVGKAMAIKLAERFGQMGLRLYNQSRGIDDRPVESDRRRKSLSVENTFTRDLTNVDECLNELPLLGQQLITRLRRVDDDYKVVKLFVKIKFSDFTTTTIERSANSVSVKTLKELCGEAYARKGMTVRLLGVGVNLIDLRKEIAFQQLDLFK
jgi:DNA polymerase-4